MLNAQVRELGGYLLGRRLYETMQVSETDPSLRDTERGAAFADVWCAIPKVVFSRARPRRRAAHVPPSGRRRWRHAVPAAGHRRRAAGPGRDQDVRLARDLRALQADS